MEPKFQTSFIPKTPITTSGISHVTSSDTSFNIVGLVSGLMFFLAIIGSGATFAYERYIKNSIAQLNTTLIESRSAVDITVNQNILSFANRLKSARSLLDRHVAVSSIFTLLQETILPTIKLSALTFSSDDKGVTVFVSGEGQNYASVAQQYNILSHTQYLHNINFSDMSLTDLGTVSFKFKATIDPQALSYAKLVQAQSTVQNPPTQ